MTNPESILKSRHYFGNKGPSSQNFGFSSSHVWMWELDYEESWAPKNWWFWTVLLEKTLDSPLDSKEIQPVHPEDNQSWTFIGRTDAEAETPIFWPPDVKSWLIWKDPDAGKDWRLEEKRTTEDEMVGWHHRLRDMSLSKLLEFVMDNLVCCSSQGCRELDLTKRLNWTELTWIDLTYTDFYFLFLCHTIFIRLMSSKNPLCELLNPRGHTKWHVRLSQQFL